MKKSFLAILLILVFSMGICVYGADDVIIYEQDFESYAGGRFETLNGAAGMGSWNALPSNQFLAKGEENGNVYMYMVNDSDSTAMSMTYKFTDSISSGVVAFSYDIAHSGNVNTVPRVRMFDGDNKELLTLFINADASVGKVCGAKPDFKSNVGFGSALIEYRDITAGEVLKVMQVLNFEDDYFETYINGEFLDRVEDLPFDVITGWGVYGYNTVSHFDNLSIKTLGDLEYSVSVTGDEGGNGIEISLPESVAAETIASLTAENIIVSDKAGEKVIVDSVTASGKTVTVLFKDKLSYDEKFNLKLDGLKDKYGRTLDEKMFMSKSEVDENGNTVLRVKNITAVTLDGEEIEIVDGITPEINKLKVEFNTFVSRFENGIKLNGKALEGAVDEKIVTLEINDVLIGNKAYTLSVDENVKSLDDTSAKTYSLNFETKEGGLIIKEFAWVTESGEKAEMSDVTQGAKLKLVFKTVNTTEKNENMYLTYSVFSGKAQKKVMLKPILSKSGKYDEFTLDYTVSENGEDIRGIVLDNFTSLTPLADFATIN